MSSKCLLITLQQITNAKYNIVQFLQFYKATFNIRDVYDFRNYFKTFN